MSSALVSKVLQSLLFTDAIFAHSLSFWTPPTPEHPPYLIPTSQSFLSQYPISHWTVIYLPFLFAGRVCGFSLSYFHPRMPAGLNRQQRTIKCILPPQNDRIPKTLFSCFSDYLIGPSTKCDLKKKNTVNV